MPPIFEYMCPKCKDIKEHLVLPGTVPKIYLCNSCNVVVDKIVSTQSFRFLGNGFYKTDYPKKNKGK